MDKFNDVFIPASQIARTAKYRDARGRRIGVQPDYVEDSDEFDISLSDGMDRNEDLGPITGLGRHLINHQVISKAEIEGGDHILAQEDRVNDLATPGRGTELTDRYQHEKDVGVSNAGLSTKALREQLVSLGETVEYCLIQAQLATNKGNGEAARILDGKAQKYMNHMAALDRRIKIREAGR